MRKPNFLRVFAIRVAFLLLACGFAGASVRASAPLRFRLLRNHLIVVPVSINGAGPFDFLLDTGTNTTLIVPELARPLGLRPVDRIILSTFTGTQVVPRAHLRSLTLGGQVLENLEVLYSDLSHVRAVDSRICGVLGQNFLSHFNYTLNYRKRFIEFEEDGRQALDEIRLSLEVDEGKMMLVVPTGISNKKNLRFVLDSAISGLVIFDHSARELDIERGADVWVTASTNEGSALLRGAYLRSFRIGSESFSNLPVFLSQGRGGDPDNHAEDGLLPTSLFRSIYFNNREGYIVLNPRPRD